MRKCVPVSVPLAWDELVTGELFDRNRKQLQEEVAIGYSARLALALATGTGTTVSNSNSVHIYIPGSL